MVHLAHYLKSIFLRKTRFNHALFQLVKGLALFLLDLLKSSDKLFFLSLKLLGFPFKFVNQLLLMLGLSSQFGLAIFCLGHSVLLD